MTDAELRDEAVAYLKQTKISYPTWADRVANGYQGKPYDGSKTAWGKAFLALDAIGAGDPIPTYEVRLSPNWLSPNDSPANNYQAVWVYPKSPTTPYRSPDSAHQQTRYLLLDPRAKDSDGRAGHDEWWFIIDRNWPASFDPENHGQWATQTNFHNVAGDVGWNSGDGVSALSFGWWPGVTAPHFRIQPHDGGKPKLVPLPKRDEFHTYVCRFVAGRTDGTTVRPGALRVWADGNDTPVIDLDGINTLQRFAGVTQKWMQLWEGDYTAALPIVQTTQFALTRIGNTPDEAIADRPFAVGDSAGGQFYDGSGVNYGPPSATLIKSRLTSESRIPQSIA